MASHWLAASSWGGSLPPAPSTQADEPPCGARCPCRQQPAPLALALLIGAGGLAFLALGQLVGTLDFGELRSALGKRRA